MRKIYSLLLLGGLLLLGAQNAFGNQYMKHAFKGSGDAYWQKLVWESGNNFYCYGKYNGTASCQVTDKDDYSYASDKTGTYFVVADGIVSGDFCKFTYTAGDDDWKVRVTKYSGTMRTVTVSSSTAYVYAWEESTGLQYNGNWPGLSASSTTLYVPDGTNLRLIFNDNGSNQSCDIYLGAISSNKTFNITIGDNKQPNTYLTGNFTGVDANDWKCWYDKLMTTGSVTVALDADDVKDFKIVYYGTWLGKGSSSTKLTPVSNNVSGLNSTDNSNNPANVQIQTSVAGDYTFTYDNANTKVTVTYPTSITRTVTSGSYGTICLPVNATISGANLYTLTTVGASSVTITPTGSNALTEGIPYIFKATANTQTITLLNTAYAEDPEDKANTNGLQGVYAGQNVATGKYILYGDKICQAGTGVTIGDNRAYFDIVVPAEAPSAFRIVESENGATNIDAIDASEEAVKFFQNGKLFIKKNGVVYDMMGTIVK